MGFKVGVLDADIYGPSIPTLFYTHNAKPEVFEKSGKQVMEPIIRHGIRMISIGMFVDKNKSILWRGPMLSNVLKQFISDTNWGQLDYLIIDTPPGTGDVHLTIFQQCKVSGVVVVTTPQKMALADVQRVIDMCTNEKLKVPILGIIENFSWFSPQNHSDEKYFIFGEGGGVKLAESSNLPLLQQIPIVETTMKYCDEGEVQKIFDSPIIRDAFMSVAKKITQYVRTYLHV